MKQIDGIINMTSDQQAQREILNQGDEDDDEQQLNELEDSEVSDLPNSLIVTNVDSRVFSICDLKNVFEETFKKFEETATFQYFKSFRRARVNFENPMSAARARIQCHQLVIGDEMINCYFAGPTLTSSKTTSNEVHLQPPAPVKQYLISPPASPPVGWQPSEEAQPCLNVELLSALASLTPGEAHELHPQSESQPGIVVHICGEEQDDGWKPKMKIQQTARPGAQIKRSSSEGSDDSLSSTP